MPGAMGASNLVSDVHARRREAWLGVSYHGGSDDQPTDWSAAWQLLNPGRTPIRGTLVFHVDGAKPISHEVVVAAGAVARVRGDAVPGLPAGRPFVVMATADHPFAAHAWLRAYARGVTTIRALSSSAGVAVQLATERGAQRRGQALAACGESGAGIRPALHLTSHRCFSLKYWPVFTATPRRRPRVVGAPAVVAPRPRGPRRADLARWGEGASASPPSVLRHHFHHGLLAVQRGAI